MQRTDFTLAEVRALFDVCIEMHLSMERHLKFDADIVHSPGFEAAVVRLIGDAPLTTADKRWLEPL